MIRALFLILLFVTNAAPAQAAPIATIAATITAFVGGGATFAVITTAVLQTLVRTGISLLVAKLRQQDQATAGVQSSQTTSGGTQPQATILGRFATKGHLVYHNSHGKNNRWLVHVVEMGDMPGATLRRLIIDGEYTELGEEDEEGRQPMSTKTDDGTVYGFIKYYDGTQTAASALLVDWFGDDEDYPWTEDHILSGTCYAVMSFRRSDTVYSSGVPSYTFELDGPPLYDPRFDGTAGGLGSQRLDDSSTWAQSANPLVIAYNVLLGLNLPDGSVWGGGFEQEALPYIEWAAAMDVCDLTVTSDTGTRTQFEAGFEVGFDESPADFLDELLATANAQVVEIGGYWYPVVGVESDVSAQITDDDVLVSESWQHAPFPGLEDTFNAVTISYSSPSSLWEASTLETVIMDDWVTEDGRQKLYELTLPMTFNAAQGRQLAQALLAENRRFRTHELPFPGEYAHLRPLQNVNLTLADYEYTEKTFRVTEVVYDLQTLNVSMSLRETDPSDFDPDLDLELPETPRFTGPVVGSDAGVTGFAVAGETLTNGAGGAYAPAIRVVWDSDLSETRAGVSIEVRLQGQEASATVSTSDVAAGSYLYQPVQAAQTYEVRARTIAPERNTVWSVWLTVSTPDVKLSPDVLSDEVWEAIADTGAAAVAPLFEDITGELDAGLGHIARDLEIVSLDSLEGDLIAQDLVDGVSRRLAYATQDLHARVDDGVEAVAGLTVKIGVQFDDAVALIQQEATARATADEANAAVASALQASIEDPDTGLAATASGLSGTTSRVTSIEGSVEALSTSIASVETTVAGNTAQVAEAMTAVNGLQAEYVLRVSAGGEVAGMVIAADAGDENATVTSVAFAADAFSISSGDASVTPFAVYTTERTINGLIYPAGVYMENIYVGAGYLGEIQTGVIQSSNFEEENGVAVAGAKIDLSSGRAWFSDVAMSRSLILAQGSFTHSGTVSDDRVWNRVNTGIRIDNDASWNLTQAPLVAFASLGSAANSSGSNFTGNEAWAYFNCQVLWGWRWTGFPGNAEPNDPVTRDPTRLVNLPGETGGSQRVMLRIQLYLDGDIFLNNPTIRWIVFQPT